MTKALHKTIVGVAAVQQPASGWQPGFQSRFQLRVDNHGADELVTESASAEFRIKGTRVGKAVSFGFPARIPPEGHWYQENNPVELTDEIAAQAAKATSPLQLLVTVGGRMGGKEVKGSTLMVVNVSPLAGPFRRVMGNNIILELTEESLDGLRNLPAIISFLDRAYDTMAEFIGMRPRNAQAMALREAPELGAWAVSGFPILLNTKFVRGAVTAFDRGEVCFGWLHEMGHNFEYGYWYMYNSPACEFHANWKVAYAVEHLFPGVDPFYVFRPWKKDAPPDMSFASGGEWNDHRSLRFGDLYLANTRRDWLSLQCDELTAFHLRVVRLYGWEPYRRMYRTYRALEAAGMPRPTVDNAIEMIKLQFVILGFHLGVDIIPICQLWRIPLTSKNVADIMATYKIEQCSVKDGATQ